MSWITLDSLYHGARLWDVCDQLGLTSVEGIGKAVCIAIVATVAAVKVLRQGWKVSAATTRGSWRLARGATRGTWRFFFPPTPLPPPLGMVEEALLTCLTADDPKPKWIPDADDGRLIRCGTLLAGGARFTLKRGADMAAVVVAGGENAAALLTDFEATRLKKVVESVIAQCEERTRQEATERVTMALWDAREKVRTEKCKNGCGPNGACSDCPPKSMMWVGVDESPETPTAPSNAPGPDYKPTLPKAGSLRGGVNKTNEPIMVGPGGGMTREEARKILKDNEGNGKDCGGKK